jgi:5-methylcytosine-specific restriction endonuclease McrA
LNASYEPLQVVSLRRAVCLMLRGVVETTSDVATHFRIRTPGTVFVVPTVLRLRYYANVPRRRAIWTRGGVLRRDNYTCIYCGGRPGDRRRGRRISRSDLTVDHLVPRSRDGRSTWGNTACACRWCNGRKADRTPHEAGMSLRWVPKTPRVNYLIASGEVPKDWKVFLRI